MAGLCVILFRKPALLRSQRDRHGRAPLSARPTFVAAQGAASLVRPGAFGPPVALLRCGAPPAAWPRSAPPPMSSGRGPVCLHRQPLGSLLSSLALTAPHEAGVAVPYEFGRGQPLVQPRAATRDLLGTPRRQLLLPPLRNLRMDKTERRITWEATRGTAGCHQFTEHRDPLAWPRLQTNPSRTTYPPGP